MQTHADDFCPFPLHFKWVAALLHSCGGAKVLFHANELLKYAVPAIVMLQQTSKLSCKIFWPAADEDSRKCFLSFNKITGFLTVSIKNFWK